MRKVLFWIILLIALFLVIVLGVAATRKVSPKTVLNDRFSRSSVSSPVDQQENTSEDIPVATGSALSDQDKQDTELFLDSLIQTP